LEQVKKPKLSQSVSMRSAAAASRPTALPAKSHFDAFYEHRALLFSIAYRMLGTVADAEDVLQETFLRWQRATDVEIETPRAYLATVVTRLCINQLQSARAKHEEYFGQWLPEPLMTARAADSRAISGIDDSLSTAFLVLFERLTPLERAVFLLREVFEYEYAEIAGMLGQSQTNCRQILRRAKQHVKEDRPRFNASPSEREKLLQQLLEATSQGEMQGLLALLSKDVVLYTDGGGKATAVPNPIYGADRVARFFFSTPGRLVSESIVKRIAQVNGQPGIVTYLSRDAHLVFLRWMLRRDASAKSSSCAIRTSCSGCPNCLRHPARIAPLPRGSPCVFDLAGTKFLAPIIWWARNNCVLP
jgi:RNA polymerase sigma-70 factor (ECF subfamily)